MKTAYRRAKALMEEKEYHKAMNDIAFCLRKDYRDENIRALYNEVRKAVNDISSSVVYPRYM